MCSRVCAINIIMCIRNAMKSAFSFLTTLLFFTLFLLFFFFTIGNPTNNLFCIRFFFRSEMLMQCARCIFLLDEISHMGGVRLFFMCSLKFTYIYVVYFVDSLMRNECSLFLWNFFHFYIIITLHDDSVTKYILFFL